MSASGLTQWGPMATCDLFGTSDPATILSAIKALTDTDTGNDIDFVTLATRCQRSRPSTRR